ncbi:PPOX class F420-dependent oxidoreductase [Streptomyces sp. NA02950]|uniref:PPOX class F420-dependent oxidoreductase n=1 Tax=Streptomyces sp. NA02950 TaxID=2742137 RepID=UPI001591FF3C|nr:PPOX class F420-dependent oxidoreductase [Streptomyces sp. NA02950]QKV96275.1 PPOX class F420-dependent oxidoreductase [Streptomyces sp. NA02950]
MAATLDEITRTWLHEPRFWQVSTLNPDGSPQLTPMWADLEDGLIVINTSVGRVKEENLRRDPRVSLCCMDTENPYHRVEVRGRAVRFVSGEPAVRVMDRLAQKYLGTETFPWLIPGEVRVAVYIEPHHVHRVVGVEKFRPGVLPDA